MPPQPDDMGSTLAAMTLAPNPQPTGLASTHFKPEASVSSP